MIEKSEIYYKSFYIVGGLLIIASIIIRFLWLEADSPPYFYNTGQALLTDPYNVIYFARNKVLFGQWDIFGFDRWIVFKYSLSSFMAYLFFAIAGVSRITANLSAILLNLGGIGIFVWEHRKSSNSAAFLSAIILFVNMTLLVYGRYPFLETGMIFFCSVFYLLFMKYYPNRWVLPVTGFVLALAIISGKLFAFVLIVPVAAIIFVENRKSFFRQFGIFLLSLILLIAAISILFYGNAIQVVYNYLSEQTIGMYGFPDSLQSPIRFFERFTTFGGDSRFTNFSPFLAAAFIIAVISLIISPSLKNRLKADRTLVFNLGWFIAGFLLLMVVNYRPLRYQLFLLLPITGIVSTLVINPIDHAAPIRLSWWKALLIFFLLWYSLVQAFVVFYLRLDGALLKYTLCWYLLIPGLIFTIPIIIWPSWIGRRLFNRRFILPILVGLCIIQQAGWIYIWYDTKSYTMKEAGDDVLRIVGKNAVIAGPYAQAVTIDNNLRSFVYMFGLAYSEPDLFRRFSITHLAIDVSNWTKAVADYPELLNSPPPAQYWIRDIELSIIRIYDAVGLSEDIDYKPTDYEKAQVFYGQGTNPDSIYYYASKFYAAHPRSKAGIKLLGNYYMACGALQSGFNLIDRLISLYPDDFSTYFDKGRANYLFYLRSGNSQFLKDSKYYFQLAREHNPYIQKDIEYTKTHADSLANSQRKQ